MRQIVEVVFCCSQAARGAHIPPNTSENEVETTFDINSIGETENNRLGILQELLELSMKDENSSNDIKTEQEKESTLEKAIPGAGDGGRGQGNMQVRGKTITTTTTTTKVSQMVDGSNETSLFLIFFLHDRMAKGCNTNFREERKKKESA